MSKSVDAFRTIGEVSEDLGVPKHVLRFWENKFPQLKPMKRGGGRRYYRPEDVALLIGIHRLLHGSGYTIKGVQRILRDDGVDAVKAAGRQDIDAGATVPVPKPVSADKDAAPRRTGKTKAALAADADLLQHLADVARELEACLKLVKTDSGTPKERPAKPAAKKHA